MSLRDGIDGAISQESVEEIRCSQENVLAYAEPYDVKDKGDVLVGGEEVLPDGFESTVDLDAFDEEDPAEEASPVGEEGVAEDEGGDDLDFGVSVDHVVFDNGPQ